MRCIAHHHLPEQHDLPLFRVHPRVTSPNRPTPAGSALWSDRSGVVRTAVALVFIATIVMFGGASRADSLAQVPVRLAAIAVLAVAFAQGGRIGSHGNLRLYAYVAAIWALMLAQLIPLPPSIWTSLPGRGLYVDGAELAGLGQTWRPLNISPDGGVNAGLALLAPTAVLCILRRLRNAELELRGMILVAALGAVLGFLQLATGEHSALRTYRVTTADAVGLFANRNHHALMLGMGIAALWGWSLLKPGGGGGRPSHRVWVAAAGTALMIVGVITAGSRAGLALAALLAAGAWLLVFRTRREGARNQSSGTSRWVTVAIAVGIAAVALAVSLSPRASAVRRLFSRAIDDDKRIRTFDTVWGMIGEYMPFGSGFGSFPQIFRHWEPLELLEFTYFNHAHNDLAELAIEGGVGALALLVVFLVWWVRSAWRIWRAPTGGAERVILARLGSVLSTAMMLASLVDYPLRTPLLSCIFVMSCWWMWSGARRLEPLGGPGADEASLPKSAD